MIVDRRGEALIDTSARVAGAESFASRPEIRAALAGRLSARRPRLEDAARAAALRRGADRVGRRVHGAVRITYPFSAVDARIRPLLAHPRADRRGRARRRGGRRPRPRPLRDPAAAQPRGSGGGRRRGPPRRARARAGGPAGGPLARRRLQRDRREARRLLRSQEEFVADASHELRTPLTALRLRLESLPPSRDRDAALHEAERLRDLVDGLLALARADAGTEPSARVDASALCASASTPGVRWRTSTASTLVARARTGRCRCAPRPSGSRRCSTTCSRTRSRCRPTAERSRSRRAPRSPWVELHVLRRGPRHDAGAARARVRPLLARRSGRGRLGARARDRARLVEADEGEVELREAPGGGVDAVVRLRRPEPNLYRSLAPCSPDACPARP